MKLDCLHYKLKFKYPFQLSAGTRDYTDIIIIRLLYNDHIGYGEASLPPHFKEDIKSVKTFLGKIDVNELIKFHDLPNTLNYIDKVDNGNNAAKAAIDIALHDLVGKIKNIPIYSMYGINQSPVYSTFTLGMGSLNEMKNKLHYAKQFNMIKLKLGGVEDEKIIENYLSICDKPFCVDVNQGWESKSYALNFIKWLKDKGAVFVEQPLPLDRWKDMEWLYARSKLPLIADESIKRVEDIDKAIGKFHGVNIKLMKSTGIHEAFSMIQKARRNNLKILIGCMSETSCAVAAARQLAPLADWIDLDAPKLTVNDPFEGLMYMNGQLLLPDGPGLGIDLKKNIKLKFVHLSN